MKTIYSILVFVALWALSASTFSLNANAALALSQGNPAGDQVLFGDTLFINPKNIKILKAQCGNGGKYGTFRLAGTATGYTPATGKRFAVLASMIDTAFSTGGTAELGSGDNDVGWNVATVPTNAVPQGVVASPSATGVTKHSILASFPAGKYPYCLGTGNSGFFVYLYGYEVAQ